MTLTLHQHPFAAYCWKPLIAITELGLAVESVLVEDRDALARLWPLASIPVLEDGDLVLPQSTTIVEHLDRGGRLVADEQARLWDRVVDQHLLTPVQTIVGDALRPAGARDPYGVDRARDALDAAYPVFDAQAARHAWLAGDTFTLADIAAAPGLHYALVVQPWNGCEHLTAYYERLTRRPSVRQVIDAARPYRGIFPLGWPAHVD